MAQPAAGCNTQTPREVAKELLLKQFGAARVADWCNVGEATVYQWLSRGTDEKPIPPDYVPHIVRGARAAGFEVSLASLWPQLQGLAA